MCIFLILHLWLERDFFAAKGVPEKVGKLRPFDHRWMAGRLAIRKTAELHL